MRAEICRVILNSGGKTTEVGVLLNPAENRGWQRSCMENQVLIRWTGHCKRSGLKKTLNILKIKHIKCSFSQDAELKPILCSQFALASANMVMRCKSMFFPPKIDVKRRWEISFHVWGNSSHSHPVSIFLFKSDPCSLERSSCLYACACVCVCACACFPLGLPQILLLVYKSQTNLRNLLRAAVQPLLCPPLALLSSPPSSQLLFIKGC